LRGTLAALETAGAIPVVAGALLVLGDLGAGYFAQQHLPLAAVLREDYELWTRRPDPARRRESPQAMCTSSGRRARLGSRRSRPTTEIPPLARDARRDRQSPAKVEPMARPGRAIGLIRHKLEDLRVLARKPLDQRLLFLGELKLNRGNLRAHACLRADRGAPRPRAREVRRQGWTAIVKTNCRVTVRRCWFVRSLAIGVPPRHGIVTRRSGRHLICASESSRGVR
jgi:hypothetical protein